MVGPRNHSSRIGVLKPNVKGKAGVKRAERKAAHTRARHRGRKQESRSGGGLRKHLLPHNNADLMIPAIIDERNSWGGGQQLAVQLDQSDAARNPGGVFHADLVNRRVITKTHGVVRPASGNAWIDPACRPAYAETQQPFDSRPIEPSG